MRSPWDRYIARSSNVIQSRIGNLQLLIGRFLLAQHIARARITMATLKGFAGRALALASSDNEKKEKRISPDDK